MITQVRLWWKLLQAGDKKGVLAGLAAHTGQISVGLSQGYSAILLPKLFESDFADQSQASWIASLGVVSNPLGALVAGLCAECFGRRSAIALATLPHAAGWLLIALSKNVPMLYAGRFISGIGTGMANGLYLYVSEAAAPDQRAWLASCGPVLVSLGVLMVYTLGAITTWQRAAVISIGPAILSLALTRTLPETPVWLAARGRTDEAKKALLWLRGPGLKTDQEYQELCEANLKRKEEKKSLLRALHMPNVWKPFLILLVFFALQQLSGIYVILFYVVNVLKDIGIDVNEYAASVGVGVIRLFASILGAGLANNIGRKTLAFASGFGMAVAAMGVALSSRFALPSWVPLLCIGTHVGASMIGFLTLPWVMTSELYPLRFRGSLGGLTTSIVQIMTFATIKTYPDLNIVVGLEFTMWIFAVAGLLGAIFALTILPETRGRSLDDIEMKFVNKQNDSTKPDTGKTSNMWSQSKNITLQRFMSISEEKQSNIIANAYAYDNFCLELTPENLEKGVKSLEKQSSLN
ncbi:facilitated trehalose transporter Tret1 isoform X2 [Harpegnathos saltator]|uniref:Solute carrier family 2, facilitated glucose transporter member 6 n=2 Tax=Harpegnathos saltator TaxID=610380 RepID=E2BQ52_HARSA|nr:facilitated trehalose transporter Tret1 isoform X2 [Harpegnathos saltator]XP_019697966.1 facilitated trehalose transporter Tret1 isoform X2 [Harpegnathos saltator]XP_025152607.1 facilitated trehalose transporter Tret1 isoform X2 [Harpegnathos saltator]XP_025152608.1 facilitated trehalose transporter Tret1 isoform X2 [Harpegnathos saltator]XP_025152609.1 facilitated trehalose transporter Tret1 isoform X2 [Harpegnathos saltator]EFN82171.1 Solute carrier family 2, facilitated glucose transport